LTDRAVVVKTPKAAKAPKVAKGVTPKVKEVKVKVAKAKVKPSLDAIKARAKKATPGVVVAETETPAA